MHVGTLKWFSSAPLCVLIFALDIGLTPSPTHCTYANFTVAIPSTVSVYKHRSKMAEEGYYNIASIGS